MNDEAVAGLRALVDRLHDPFLEHDRAMKHVSFVIQLVVIFSLVLCWPWLRDGNAPSPKWPPLVHWFDKLFWYCLMAEGPAVVGFLVGTFWTRRVAIQAKKADERELEKVFAHIWKIAYPDRPRGGRSEETS
jgi:hypothetical protein